LGPTVKVSSCFSVTAIEYLPVVPAAAIDPPRLAHGHLQRGFRSITSRSDRIGRRTVYAMLVIAVLLIIWQFFASL